MPERWITMAFREFLTPRLRPHTLGPDEDANLVGIQWYGEGPFHREFKAATKIAKKEHFVIHSGDVIYNKLFAWKGTFGIVPNELDGMFCSDKFPTYELNRAKVSEAYLKWYFRYSPLWDQARQKSTGSAAISKLTLNPPKFLELTLVAPEDVVEQERIALRLENLAEKRREICSLKESVREQISVLKQVVLTDCLKGLNRTGRLGDVLSGPPRNGWSVKCDNAEGGIAVLALGAVTGYEFNPDAIKYTSEPTDPSADYWLTNGDLLITRSNTPELVGHVAIYRGEPTPCIYPDLMMLLQIDEAKASKEFVWYWLQTTPVRQFIRAKAKGTSPTMKKISQPTVMAIPFPTGLALDEQVALVSQIQRQLGVVEEMKKSYGTWQKELNSVIPGMLARAFTGKL